MKVNRTLLLAMLLAPAMANAKYYVQPVANQEIDLSSVVPITTSIPIYQIESTEDLNLDVVANGVVMTDIEVSVLEILPDRTVKIEISNNTMREFSDINLEINHSGYTLDTPLEGFTKKTILVSGLISVQQESDIKFLDPYPIFNANSNEYLEPLTDLQIQAYYRLQTNLKTAYGQHSSFDKYMWYFRDIRGESFQDSLSKWFHNATYQVTKSYRLTLNNIGVSGGYWHALGPKYLNNTATYDNYFSGYRFFSHENSHSMGFKHGSGMAYGWDDYVYRTVEDATSNGLSSNLEQVPLSNNMFWSYDVDYGLRLYVKAGTEFQGLDSASLVYDSSTTKIGEPIVSLFGTTYPIASIKSGSDILLQAKATNSDTLVNYIIRTSDTGLSSQEEFDALYDPTPAQNELDVIANDAERQEIAIQFPESDVWVGHSDNPLMVNYKGSDYPLCKFNHVTQLLAKNTLFGHVENGECTIGDDNGFYQEGAKGMVSSAYQVVDLNSNAIPKGNLTAYVEHEGAEIELCYVDGSDDRVDAVGYKNPSNGKCVSKMRAYNGKHYVVSNGYNQFDMTPYYQIPENIEQIMDEERRTFPESEVWKFEASSMVMAHYQGEEYPVCKFNDVSEELVKTTLFGMVIDEVCTIGGNNSYQGINGFSSDIYQVADKDGGEGSLTSYVDQQGDERAVCNVIHTDTQWHGVGYRPEGSKQCYSNIKAANGNDYGFSRNHVTLEM